MGVGKVVAHLDGCRLRFLLILLLLLLQLGELLGDLGAVGANFPVVAQLAALTEVRLAHLALEGLLARVRVFVLLLVLRQTERLRAEAALERLLRVVLLVVPLQTELCLERRRAAKDVTFKDGRSLGLIHAVFLTQQRIARLAGLNGYDHAWSLGDEMASTCASGVVISAESVEHSAERVNVAATPIAVRFRARQRYRCLHALLRSLLAREVSEATADVVWVHNILLNYFVFNSL